METNIDQAIEWLRLNKALEDQYIWASSEKYAISTMHNMLTQNLDKIDVPVTISVHIEDSVHGFFDINSSLLEELLNEIVQSDRIAREINVAVIETIKRAIETRIKHHARQGLEEMQTIKYWATKDE